MRTFSGPSLRVKDNSPCKTTRLRSGPRSHHRPLGILATTSAQQESRTERGATQPEPQHGSADGLLVKVLVVDDSPFILKTLSSFLEGQSRMQLVGTATDGFRAVRLAMELEPDLVFIDLHLPRMSGLEATRQIKARSPATAVIMLTSDATPENRAAASAAAADSFIDKQHMFTQLPAVIRKLFPGNDAPRH